jgi:sec-independent protein translocase protein TatA
MPAFLFLPGNSEWIVIIAAIAIVFGATRIPQMMKGLGQGIKEFKQAVKEEEPAKPTEPAKSDAGAEDPAPKAP